MLINFINSMKKFYTIFFFIDLKPVSFYLYTNFFDLVYNNFNMSEDQVQEGNKEFYYL